MSTHDGGPAYPRALPKGEFPPDDILRIIEQHAGMTLRDYFAGQMLPAIAGSMEVSNAAGGDPAGVAAVCYSMADYMLQERDR